MDVRVTKVPRRKRGVCPILERRNGGSLHFSFLLGCEWGRKEPINYCEQSSKTASNASELLLLRRPVADVALAT